MSIALITYDGRQRPIMAQAASAQSRRPEKFTKFLYFSCN
jgi:hypothetical protein